MAINHLRRKMENLRQQPESVRMRAALLMTGVSGTLIAIVWLTLLLPLQLRLNNDSDNEVADVPASVATPVPGEGSSQVGGVQDRQRDDVLLPDIPTVTPSPLTTPEYGLPVELLP